jgi:hypothetical protein
MPNSPAEVRRDVTLAARMQQHEGTCCVQCSLVISPARWVSDDNVRDFVVAASASSPGSNMVHALLSLDEQENSLFGTELSFGSLVLKRFLSPS